MGEASAGDAHLIPPESQKSPRRAKRTVCGMALTWPTGVWGTGEHRGRDAGLFRAGFRGVSDGSRRPRSNWSWKQPKKLPHMRASTASRQHTWAFAAMGHYDAGPVPRRNSLPPSIACSGLSGIFGKRQMTLPAARKEIALRSQGGQPRLSTTKAYGGVPANLHPIMHSRCNHTGIQVLLYANLVYVSEAGLAPESLAVHDLLHTQVEHDTAFA